MFTDYDRGDLPYLSKLRCHHRWKFHCFFDDPTWRKGAKRDLRFLVTKCPRCGRAKSTLLADGYQMCQPTYAPDIPTMMLGRELTKAELFHMQQAIGVN